MAKNLFIVEAEKTDENENQGKGSQAYLMILFILFQSLKMY